MIYDLYGMPGSGKSTICKRLENEIGIKNAKDKYIEKIVGRIIFRLYLKLYFLDSISRKMYKRITNIIGNLNKYENCMNKKTDISLYIKYMLFDYFLERKIKKDVIIDEGIIHYGISLFVEFGLEEEKMKQIIELLKLDKVKYIGLKISIEECLNNIYKRNRKRCDMDFLNNDKLKELLIRWEEGFNIVSKDYIALEKDELIKYIKEIN